MMKRNLGLTIIPGGIRPGRFFAPTRSFFPYQQFYPQPVYQYPTYQTAVNPGACAINVPLTTSQRTNLLSDKKVSFVSKNNCGQDVAVTITL